MCGILSITKWPEESTIKSEINRVSNDHSPGKNNGLNMVQELLAKTRITRVNEEARTWYLPCNNSSHIKCGVSHGVHLSIKTVANEVKSMQKKLSSDIFGCNGLIRGANSETSLKGRIKNICDDADNDTIGYSFVKHVANEDMGSMYDELVRTEILSLDDDASDVEMNQKVISILERIDDCSHLLLTLLTLVGGLPGRGRETAFQTICNTRSGIHRSIFLYNGRVVIIPGYKKNQWTSGGKCFVARVADSTTTELYKYFVLLLVPYRRYLQRGLLFCEGKGARNQ